MKIKEERGFTGIDISVAIVILFMFVTTISILIYQLNSTSQEIELKSEAIYIAINEIEQVKSNGIQEYMGIGNNTIVGNEKEEIKGHKGFYKTISVIDYKDIKEEEDKKNGTNEAENIKEDIVKKVTVKIYYMYQAKEQMVELSTIVSKEN